MFADLELDAKSDVPLYRQVFLRLNECIRSGKLPRGGRLPATRELAGLLGVNRATVSAAYELLEAEGLIAGQVGRGSFVTGIARVDAGEQLDWQSLLASPEWTAAPAVPASPEMISFAASRPSEQLFPMEEFRATCREVTARSDLSTILQLGSPGGYAPLRHYLLDIARREGLMRDNDDLIVTSGCQQALDLLRRVLIRPGDRVAIEDPVYPGLKNLFTSAGAQAVGVGLGSDGIDLE
ncbi:MAG: PLP-dependent aminotransferase family protein, partial [Bryobacteraceae bacterium]